MMGFNENDQRKIWKEYVEKLINKENESDHLIEADAVEGPIENVTLQEFAQEIRKIKSGKAVDLRK